MVHLAYDSIDEFIEKQNRYSTLSKKERNKIKALINPYWTFFKLFFIKKGFLDGWTDSRVISQLSSGRQKQSINLFSPGGAPPPRPPISSRPLASLLGGLRPPQPRQPPHFQSASGLRESQFLILYMRSYRKLRIVILRGRLEMGGLGGRSPPNREAGGRLEMGGLGGRSPPNKG